MRVSITDVMRTIHIRGTLILCNQLQIAKQKMERLYDLAMRRVVVAVLSQLDTAILNVMKRWRRGYAMAHFM